MTMIEVDPKLFITCRLCLDEMGVYQIVPSVQHLIKFCFDIEVQPFDGLPQLICKKCEAILSDFNIKKKVFLEKQTALKYKVQGGQASNELTANNVEHLDKKTIFENCEHIEDVVTSSQSHDELFLPEQEIAAVEHCSRQRESSSVDSAQKQGNETVKPITLVVNMKKTKKRKAWQNSFSKQFICKLCDKSSKSKRTITNHLKDHEKLMLKFRHIYNTCCSVSMDKIDDKPNMTDSLNTVVLDNHTVIQNYHYKHYLVKFITKKSKVTLSDDSSEEDELIIRSNTNKRRRITSNDTVVLDDHPIQKTEPIETNDAKKKIVEAECINIIDSSDDELTNNQSSEPQGLDYRTIQNIISVCHGKYLKKVEAQDSDEVSSKKKNPATFESLLKKKILSIGRKTITKQGFNCNGILRFLDHKNLDIDWKPVKHCAENNHVRIITQERLLKKKGHDSAGWKKVNQYFEENENPNVSSYMLDKNPTVETWTNADKPSEKSSNIDKDNAIIDTHTSQKNSVSCPVAEEYISRNKLLNENPVANPKQLPKKPTVNIVEGKTNKSNEDFIADSASDPKLPVICMPIITSTTSLAQIDEINDNSRESESVASVADAVQDKPAYPRIKVKPVSELMPAKAIFTNNVVQGHLNSQYQLVNMPMRVTGTVPLVFEVEAPPAPAPPPQQQSSTDAIMLDTVELPHCKTNSPFRYFQNLLQIHSLVLLDCSTLLVPEFKCLIKFKVHYAEGAKDKPIVLCSSLMCLDNQFCIKIKDANHEQIDITKLSANWQWEILKTFRSDVATKMVENASKVSRNVYSNTNIFIRLLKSIVMQRIT